MKAEMIGCIAETARQLADPIFGFGADGVDTPEDLFEMVSACAFETLPDHEARAIRIALTEEDDVQAIAWGAFDLARRGRATEPARDFSAAAMDAQVTR